jgi:hypothetical protein
MWFGILLSVLVLLRVCSFSGVSVGLRKYDCSFVLGSRLIYAPVLVRVCLVYVFGISGYAARQGRVLVLV